MELLPCQASVTPSSQDLSGPFILEPQEVGKGIGQASASRRGWKEVAFNLRQGLLGAISFPGPRYTE